MNSLMNKLAKKMVPWASKMAANRYLTAIRDAFITIMPIIIGCSFCILINSVFLGKDHYFDQWFHFQGLELANMLAAASSAGMSVMSLLIVYLVARNLAAYYKMDTTSNAVVAVVNFLVLTQFDTTPKLGEVIRTYYLGAAGLFTGFIAAFVSVEIMRKLGSIKKLQIKMPESVPAAIAKSFNGMMPIILTMLIFGLVRLCTNLAGKPLNDLIFNGLQQPLSALVTSPIGIVIIYILYMLLWGFGIHTGFIISAPILEPIFLVNLTQNAEKISNNAAAHNILTKPFTDSMMFMGGAGNMLALVIAIFIVSKRDDYRKIAKLGLIPSLFNISEPIMFGLPVVMNPILIIPMILTTLVGLGVGSLATITGFMGYTYVLVPWTTSPLLNAFLSTGGSWGALVTAAVVLVLSVLIYMPFVMVMNRTEKVEASDDEEK
ncbi:PTS sugar transporter subunit IIC [Lactobacillus gasseri]|uniref:PTS sugar transporter subunit IIC n=1 Tax=Lactobacillus gasseri TaxID=1596 RepID=UPI0022E3B549|nr:PTS transporter subunit EIIC [Lactobacillus gasseri]